MHEFRPPQLIRWDVSVPRLVFERVRYSTLLPVTEHEKRTAVYFYQQIGQERSIHELEKAIKKPRAKKVTGLEGYAGATEYLRLGRMSSWLQSGA